MRKLLILTLICMSSHVLAQDHFKNIIVHAHGVTIKLNEADIRYVIANSHSQFVNEALSFRPQTIRNCEAADQIIAIIHNRDKESTLVGPVKDNEVSWEGGKI